MPCPICSAPLVGRRETCSDRCRQAHARAVRADLDRRTDALLARVRRAPFDAPAALMVLAHDAGVLLSLRRR